MTKYSRYQDYVIKNGKFVGEFEQMYKDYDDPWEQTTREQFVLEKKIGLEIIRNNGFKRVVEFGCGFGNYTSQIFGVTGNALGIDISKTAIDKAKAIHPNVDFVVGDILDFEVLRNYKPDCIVFGEITWYVLDKLSEFREFARNEFTGKGVGFLHLLVTYPAEKQQYGCEFFTDLQGIMEYWDEINFCDWGEISKKEYQGGKRTFCFGKFK